MKKILLSLSVLVCCLSAQAALLDQIGFDAIGISHTHDMKSYKNSAGIRLSYDVTDKFALFTEASGNDFHGTLIEDAAVGMQLGLPFKLGPVQPYIVSSVGIKLPSNEEYVTGGIGAKLPLGKHFHLFVEGSAEMGVKSGTGAKFVGGISLRF